MVNQLNPQMQNHVNQVTQVLQNYVRKNVRVRLFLGDPATGEQWLEEHNIQGYVISIKGSAPNFEPTYYLLDNRRSNAGIGIRPTMVIRITVDKTDVFRVPNYHLPQLVVQPAVRKVKGVTHSVYHKKLNGEVEFAMNFTSEEKAKHYIKFQHGLRNKI